MAVPKRSVFFIQIISDNRLDYTQNFIQKSTTCIIISTGKYKTLCLSHNKQVLVLLIWQELLIYMMLNIPMATSSIRQNMGLVCSAICPQISKCFSSSRQRSLSTYISLNLGHTRLPTLLPLSQTKEKLIVAIIEESNNHSLIKYWYRDKYFQKLINYEILGGV